MSMPKIELSRLKKIIREEMIRHALNEGPEQDSIAKQTAAAAKLLSAIEAFNESASAKAKAEVSQCIEELQKILNRMFDSPKMYVDATEPPADKSKKVSLKPAAKKTL